MTWERTAEVALQTLAAQVIPGAMTPPPVGITTGPGSSPPPTGPTDEPAASGAPPARRRERSAAQPAEAGGGPDPTPDPPGATAPARAGDTRSPSRPTSRFTTGLAGVAAVAAGIQAPLRPRRLPPPRPAPGRTVRHRAGPGTGPGLLVRRPGPGLLGGPPARAHGRPSPPAHPPAGHGRRGRRHRPRPPTWCTWPSCSWPSVVLAGVTVRDLVGERAGIAGGLGVRHLPPAVGQPGHGRPRDGGDRSSPPSSCSVRFGSGPGRPRPMPPWSGWPSGSAP